MKLKELCSFLDTSVPLSFQEDYDNSGLQTGDPEKELKSGLLTLDVTEEVLDEAVKEGCDIIISHHPVLFRGLKRITGQSVAERIIIKSIRNDIAIYSSHTNLDIINNGVSFKMAGKLGLQNIKVLSPVKGHLLKLVTFIPGNYLQKVSRAIFDAGAGVIGNYDECGFSVEGTGSFRAGEDTDPFVGQKGKTHFEKEVRFETILLSHLRDRVVKALLSSHPYEEVAYDIYRLENDNINAGLGCSGELKEPLTDGDFIKLVSEVFEARGLRHSGISGKIVEKVALCGGSGSSLIGDAIASGSDAYITGDLKYHTYFEAENKILLVDCGHYETEKFSTEILYDLINKKFPKFALRFSKINTNPINYL